MYNYSSLITTIMINVNLSDIKAKFEEVYSDPTDAYLFPSYHLGYLAGLMPKFPDLAIPGHDAHMIVAAHTGRITAEILKLNKARCERAIGKRDNTQETSMYSISTSKKSATF